MEDINHIGVNITEGKVKTLCGIIRDDEPPSPMPFCNECTVTAVQVIDTAAKRINELEAFVVAVFENAPPPEVSLLPENFLEGLDLNQ